MYVMSCARDFVRRDTRGWELSLSRTIDVIESMAFVMDLRYCSCDLAFHGVDWLTPRVAGQGKSSVLPNFVRRTRGLMSADQKSTSGVADKRGLGGAAKGVLRERERRQK